MKNFKLDGISITLGFIGLLMLVAFVMMISKTFELTPQEKAHIFATSLTYVVEDGHVIATSDEDKTFKIQFSNVNSIMYDVYLQHGWHIDMTEGIFGSVFVDVEKDERKVISIDDLHYQASTYRKEGDPGEYTDSTCERSYEIASKFVSKLRYTALLAERDSFVNRINPVDFLQNELDILYQNYEQDEVLNSRIDIMFNKEGGLESLCLYKAEKKQKPLYLIEVLGEIVSIKDVSSGLKSPKEFLRPRLKLIALNEIRQEVTKLISAK